MNNNNVGANLAVVTTKELKAVYFLVTGKEHTNNLQVLKTFPSVREVKKSGLTTHFEADAVDAWLHFSKAYGPYILKHGIKDWNQLLIRAIEYHMEHFG